MEKYKEYISKDMVLIAPNTLGSVWPKQSCPMFLARENCSPDICECWYCVYADFHLNKPRALEVGICNWPKKIMK